MTQETVQDQIERVRELLAGEPAASAEVLRAAIEDLHPADIAALLAGTPPEQRFALWDQVEPHLKGEVLLEVADGVREDLVERMDSQQLVAAASELDTDDVADLLPDLPEEVVTQVLLAMDRQDRERLEELRQYPEDTAGGLMDSDVITVRKNITVEVVLRYLRRRGDLPDYTNRLYVVDRNNRLIGTLRISQVVSNDPGRRVADLMDTEPVKFTAMTKDSEVAEAFERYNLVTAPVVDEANHLVGRITIDDVVDVIREQADHSVLAPAGLSEEEDIFAPVAESARNRALWLGVNLLTAVIASWVIGQFEATIGKLVALAVLMPIVASMGGNAGTQTLTLVIRGLATGTVNTANARRVLRKELLVGGLNGLLWALVVAAIAATWYHDLSLGLVIAVAMIINLVFAALAGVLLPVALRRLGVDPALASGVALTTVTDVIGFLAFLGLATLFLV